VIVLQGDENGPQSRPCRIHDRGCARASDTARKASMSLSHPGSATVRCALICHMALLDIPARTWQRCTLRSESTPYALANPD
jgi:hypothetical protein